MNLNLKNKKVLITGSSKGIGMAIAECFLKEGSQVFLTSRNKNDLKSLKKKLEKKYGMRKIFSFNCDFTKLEEIKLLRDYIKKKWKRFDFLVLNVGSGEGKPSVIPKVDDFEKSFSLNFFSAFYPVSSLYPLLNKNGAITFISSIAGEEIIGAPLEYSVSKSAIISLSKNLSLLTKNGIRFNTVSPGNIFFKNGTWDKKINLKPHAVKRMLQEKVPLKRFGKPEEVGDLVVYLCSEKASFINGALIRIDGGQTIKI